MTNNRFVVAFHALADTLSALGARWVALRPHLLALISYSLLACLATLPLVFHIHTYLPAMPSELSQDLWQNVWNVWWVHQALVVEHTNPYTTTMLFYPHGASLYLHTLNLPLNFVGIPLLALFPIVMVYNMLTLLVLVLAGYTTFLLARYLTGNTAAAIIAGAIVLCSPLRLNELRLAQLPTVSDYGVPLAILFTLMSLKTRRRSAMVTAAGALLLCGLSSWYHLLHTLLLLGLLLVWRAIVAWRSGKGASLRQELIPWGAIAAISMVFILPFLFPVLIESSTLPHAQKGADLVASATLRHVVAFPLIGIGQPGGNGGMSPTLFAWVPLLLALVGLLATPRQTVLWLLLAVVCFILSLGPQLTLDFGAGKYTLPMPYAVLRALPFMRMFRAPVRINAVTTLLISIIAAIGLAKVFRPLAVPRVWLVVGILVALIALETLRPPFPLTNAAISPFYARIANEPGRWSMLELPIDRPDRRLLEMFAQTHHGHPILTGQTSRDVPRVPYESAPPIAQIEQIDTRPDIVQLASTNTKQLFQALRIRYLVIHHDSQDRERANRQAVIAAQVLPFSLTKVYSDHQLTAYRLDEMAAWLDDSTTTNCAEMPLFLGLNLRWHPPEHSTYGWSRWLPAKGGGLWTYTQQPRRVVLELSLYSLPGARPLEIWLNGHHIQTLPIPSGITPRLYRTSPFMLPAGPSLIELHAPQGGTSPSDLGLGEDTRSLSFSILHAQLREVLPVDGMVRTSCHPSTPTSYD